MPSFHPPDYIHLRGHLPPNESQMQLMADQTPSPSPTPDRALPFPIRVNGTADADDSLPSVLYKKKNIGFWARRTQLEKLLLGLLLLLFIGFVTVLALFAKAEEKASDSQLLPNVNSLPHQKASELLEPFAFHSPPPEQARDGENRIADLATGKLDEGVPAANFPTSTTPQLPTTTSATQNDICATKGCVKAASSILSAIDQNVNPCEDFYEYACGQWNRDHPIPDDMFGYGTFAFVREHVRQQMRVLLEDTIKSPSRSINMARLTYTGCMNTTELERLKATALLSALEDLGYWPLLHGDKWQPNSFDITEMLGKTRRMYGNEVFFSLYVYADARNTSKNTLYIDQGVLGLGRGSRDYYLNDTVFAHQLNAYHKYLFDVVRILIADANETRSRKEVNQDLIDIIEFEKKLAAIIIPEDDRRNHTRMYNMRKISDLSVMLPQIDWIEFLKEVMPTDVLSLASPDTEIIVCEIEYLEKIADLLNSTDDRLKANYILWRVTQAWTKILDDRFEDIKQDFLRIMTGQQQKSPRWKECTQGPTSWLPLAAGSMYVREHFDVSDKKEALEMIGNLRESFTELVYKNDWMDEITKQIAIEKAGSMINHIGYPDFIKNDTALDDHYHELNIIPSDSYFEAVRKIIVWSQEKEFRRLLKPFDKLEFEVSPAIVNAFYSPEKNAITFPAGILQPPFFSGEFPKAINYGAIGAVIGHEITHGFDDQGSQFDKDGNLKNWWNPAALEGFDNRKECIINQYSSYQVPDTEFHVNGRLTQGENIADNGGVKEAYMAYRKYVDKLGHEEPLLPGLTNFSNNQLFFLSYAHFWCGHKKQAAAVQQVLTDEHSPEVFRVIGVLSNLEEFSTAFNCPKNSRLNPEKRCVVW